MKITKSKLKEIIKEEYNRTMEGLLKENDPEWVDVAELEPRAGKSMQHADAQRRYEEHMEASRSIVIDLYGEQVWELITQALYAHTGKLEGVMPLHQEIADLAEPEPPTLDEGDK